MGHNIYINIVLSTDMEEFPIHEHGIPAQIRKQVKEIVGKDNSFKLRRLKFDIVDEEIEFEDEFVDYEDDDAN
jgi:hypothetical protein